MSDGNQIWDGESFGEDNGRDDYLDDDRQQWCSKCEHWLEDCRCPSPDDPPPEPVIKTSFVHPPIPVRGFDWCAVFDGYEPGCPIGYGETEEAAIANLRELCATDEDR